MTGKVPFASAFETGDPLVMFGAVVRKEVEVPLWLPRSVRQALSKALQKKREDRFSSCMQFTDALKQGVKSSGISKALIFSVLLSTIILACFVFIRNRDIANGEDIQVSASAPKLVQALAPKTDQKLEVEPMTTSVAVVDKKAIAPDKPQEIQKFNREPQSEPVKMPPELMIVAEFEGEEVAGAKIQTMNGVFDLPYKWDGDIAHRRQLGPYKVTCERGNEYLTGEFKVESINWSGLKTIKVRLKRSDRDMAGGIQSWAF